jgi:hypothetical protein
VAWLVVLYLDLRYLRRERDRYQHQYQQQRSINMDWSAQHVRWKREVDQYFLQYREAQCELAKLRKQFDESMDVNENQDGEQ